MSSLVATSTSAVGVLAGVSSATTAILWRRLFTIPGPAGSHRRRHHLRLSANSPWSGAFLAALVGLNAHPMCG